MSSPPPKLLQQLWNRLQGQPKRLLHWYVLGTKTTPPPDLFKQRVVARLGREFGLSTFVETGTYHGDMTAAAVKTFANIYSIELHRPFYDQAVNRFKQTPHVHLLFGDSGTIIRDVLPTLPGPALFWLDAHGGQAAKNQHGQEKAAPVLAEIQAILADARADQHVILVDDVHTLTRNVKWGAGVWSVLEKLRREWLQTHSGWIWKVEDNILRIYRDRFHERH